MPRVDDRRVISGIVHVLKSRVALGWTALALAVFLGVAIYGYNPARGMMPRKGVGGG